MEGYTSGSTDAEFEVKPDFDDQKEEAVNPFADFGTEMEKIRQQQAPSIILEPTLEAVNNETEVSIKTEDGDSIDPNRIPNQQEDILARSWASEMQLITFRTSAAAVADEHLKKQDVKLFASGCGVRGPARRRLV